MELVYLWVEKYKNIEKQGFNFSSKFDCNVKMKPKEHIKDFFGKDINITAIVGENGSGKSNILEALVSLFAENGIPIDADYHICIIFYDDIERKFYSKDIKRSICRCSTDDFQKIYKLNRKDYHNKSFLLHYNYTFDFLDNDENNIRFNEMYHKVDNYNVPILLQPDKSDNKINLNLIDYFATRDMFEFVFKENLPIKNIKNFFNPTKFKLSFHFSYIYGESKQDENFSRNTSLFDYIKACSLNGTLNIHDAPKPYGIEDYSSSLENITRDGLILLTRFYILKKSIRKTNLIIDEKLKKSLSSLDTKFDTALDIIEHNSFEVLFSSEHYYQTYKIKDSFEFIEFLKKQEEDFRLLDKKQLISKNQELIENLAPWITINVYNDKDVSLSELSYGQKFIIRFLYSLLNQLRNLNSHPEYKDIVLLLDEVENGLHPQWQKEFIKLLIDVLNSFLEKYPKRFKFNIILTSHSPFIISDLPKGNIIFLKDGKQVDVDINPFGANIHTLLSNGFFMKGGLMGEFAKNKIRTIKVAHRYILHKHEKKLLTKKSYDKSKQLIIEKLPYFRQIKKIIGEPFLQKIVKNQLEEMELILLAKNEAIDNEIARLQALKASLR